MGDGVQGHCVRGTEHVCVPPGVRLAAVACAACVWAVFGQEVCLEGAAGCLHGVGGDV